MTGAGLFDGVFAALGASGPFPSGRGTAASKDWAAAVAALGLGQH
jgi:hypothetical protein